MLLFLLILAHIYVNTVFHEISIKQFKLLIQDPRNFSVRLFYGKGTSSGPWDPWGPTPLTGFNWGHRGPWVPTPFTRGPELFFLRSRPREGPQDGSGPSEGRRTLAIGAPEGPWAFRALPTKPTPLSDSIIKKSRAF